jgi:prophage DNA circulation protein
MSKQTIPTLIMSDETQSNLNDRVTDLEVNMADVKSALNQLIDYSVQNERRLTDAIDRLAQTQTQTLQIVERVQLQVGEMQSQILGVQNQVLEVQSEVRGLQTENRRILDLLLNENDSPEGEN